MMGWFKNLNAAPKLMLSFGVLIAMIAGISYLGIDSLAKANARIESLYRLDLVGSTKASDITINVATIGRLSNHAMVHAADSETVAGDRREVLANLAEMRANLDAADKLFVNKTGLEKLSIIRGALPNYEQAEATLFRDLEAKDVGGSLAALEATSADRKTIREASDVARASKQEHAEEQFQANLAAFQSTRNTMLASAAAALALGLGLSFFLARGFSVPLALAVGALNAVAAGDLTVSIEVQTVDEVGRMGRALNQALDKLRTTLREVAASAATASASSQELASATEAIASGAQQQAASLEETSASIAETSASLEQTSASLEEITATVSQTADNAKRANQLASASRDAASSGQGVVSTAVAAMAEINAASAKIADIIGTIDEIAFQTNLLAVNAAIEAARAGDEGRGFAVVATEVRTLAQRSAGAAKEIKALIQDSLRKVEKGTELVNNSGQTLHEIVGSVKRVTDIVGEISSAAGEQSTGVAQVNTAMTQVSQAVEQVSTAMSQMDQVTQSNAAQTEELSSTAQAMAEQAGRLTELVAAFQLGAPARDSFAAPRANRGARRPNASAQDSALARRNSGGNGGQRLRREEDGLFANPARDLDRARHRLRRQLRGVLGRCPTQTLVRTSVRRFSEKNLQAVVSLCAEPIWCREAFDIKMELLFSTAGPSRPVSPKAATWTSLAAILAISLLAHRVAAQNAAPRSSGYFASATQDGDVFADAAEAAKASGGATGPVLLTRPAAEPAAAEIVANPGRPALATSALLTPEGYVQLENGVLFASGSAQFANRAGQEETMRFTVAPRLQFIVAAEPVAFSAGRGADSTREGDLTGGFQTVLKANQGWRPTVAIGYLRLLRGGEATDLDIGGFKNSVLLQASSDFGHWHVDANLFANEQAQAAVRRAQWGQAVAITHPVSQKLGVTGEVRHFTEPFNAGPGWGVMAAAGYSVHPNLVLDLGVTRGFTAGSTRWQVASGVTYVLPRGVWGLGGRQ